MSRSPEAIKRRSVALIAKASAVATRLRHEGKDYDAECIQRLVQSHQQAVYKIEALLADGERE